MSSTRIIFMGTPDFAVASLKALVDKGHNIVGVITAPDRPAGRGRKLKASAVKQYAMEQKLRVLQPTNLKNPEFLKELSELEADLQIVVAFRMLPEAVWKLPRLGTFNLHASLLPDYRGAAPINWAIMNGETHTGVTTFFINENIDTGAILLQRKVPISEDMDAGELHDVLMAIGSELVTETVEQIEKGEARAKEQKEGAMHMAPKLNKSNCRIDWKQNMKDIFNHIRGLSPYPGAWSVLQNGDKELECKIFKSEMVEEKHTEVFGTVSIRNKQILIAVDSGYLRVLEIQLPGKRKMDAKSLLNGFEFLPGAIFV